MPLQSKPGNPTADQLRNAIDWSAKCPEYVFSENKIRGFFVIGSGIFATRDFLDFMLGESLKTSGAPLSVLVRLNEEPARDLFFSTSTIDEIRNLQLHLTQGSLDLFGSIIAVTGSPSEWVAYEETNEGFAVLALFDIATFERWSSKDSGIWDYALSKEQIVAKLSADEWPGWDPTFLRKILESYGKTQDQLDL